MQLVQVTFEQALGDAILGGYRLACAMLHDPTEAEDVVQEAALKAWRKQSQLRPGSDLMPWFLGIVANECRSRRRTRWWSVVRVGDWSAHAGSAAPAAPESVTDLRRALLALPELDRLVVSLYFYLDLPLDEVARAAGISPDAARGRLYRAIQRLRPGVEVEEALR
jgi:RNA polymerase sigma factor (sigma-70 family)